MCLFQSSWVLMPHHSTRDYGKVILNDSDRPNRIVQMNGLHAINSVIVI